MFKEIENMNRPTLIKEFTFKKCFRPQRIHWKNKRVLFNMQCPKILKILKCTLTYFIRNLSW